MAKYKYCIWDMGKVIYVFSFRPLDKWCRENTTNLETYQTNLKKLDYDAFMKGDISFSDWSRDLCILYSIPWRASRPAEINKALHQGVSAEFEITRKMRGQLVKSGIDICILSNALPILKDTGNCWDLVKKEHCFTSFELGLLKPNPQIFEAVRSNLGCHFSEMIFIDDKKINTESAQRLGITAITFTPDTIASRLDAAVFSRICQNSHKRADGR